MTELSYSCTKKESESERLQLIVTTIADAKVRARTSESNSRPAAVIDSWNAKLLQNLTWAKRNHMRILIALYVQHAVYILQHNKY